MKSLELKLFHRTQRELATAINQVVDAYWRNEMAEKHLIENIKALYNNNSEKLLKEDKFTTIIQQQCGKRRLSVVKNILELPVEL